MKAIDENTPHWSSFPWGQFYSVLPSRSDLWARKTGPLRERVGAIVAAIIISLFLFLLPVSLGESLR